MGRASRSAGLGSVVDPRVDEQPGPVSNRLGTATKCTAHAPQKPALELDRKEIRANRPHGALHGGITARNEKVRQRRPHTAFGLGGRKRIAAALASFGYPIYLGFLYLLG